MLRRHSRTLLLAVATALTLTACANGDGDEPADDTAFEDVDDTVSVTGLDTIEWDADTLEAEPGVIGVELTCEDAVNHDLVIDETDETVAECAPGETAQGTVELDEGEYTYVCTVPGHEQQMRGTLTVG